MRPSTLIRQIPWIPAGDEPWAARLLAPNEVLWHEGQPAEDVAVLVRGRLGVEVTGRPVGDIAHHEIVGEGAAFFRDARRSATVRSLGWSWILTLPTEALGAARRRAAPVYDALLAAAVTTLARRVVRTDHTVARLAAASQPRPARDGLRRRMFRRLTSPGSSAPCPPLIPLMRRLPGLGDADPRVLAALSAGWVPVAVEAGQTLFLEGDRAGPAWIVASGHLDVLRNTQAGGATRLASLGPGMSVGLLGEAAGAARTASVVSTENGWLYRHDEPTPPTPTERRAWRECLLASFAIQLRTANRSVSGDSDDPYGAAIKALGELTFVAPEHP